MLCLVLHMHHNSRLAKRATQPVPRTAASYCCSTTELTYHAVLLSTPHTLSRPDTMQYKRKKCWLRSTAYKHAPVLPSTAVNTLRPDTVLSQGCQQHVLLSMRYSRRERDGIQPTSCGLA
jgi:hypothetical protein